MHLVLIYTSNPHLSIDLEAVGILALSAIHSLAVRPCYDTTDVCHGIRARFRLLTDMFECKIVKKTV